MLPWKKPPFELQQSRAVCMLNSQMYITRFCPSINLQHLSEILGFAFFVGIFCILPWFVSPFRGMCLELFSAIGKGTFCKNISPWDVIVIGKQRFEIQISLTNPIQKGVFFKPLLGRTSGGVWTLQTPILQVIHQRVDTPVSDSELRLDSRVCLFLIVVPIGSMYGIFTILYLHLA